MAEFCFVILFGGLLGDCRFLSICFLVRFRKFEFKVLIGFNLIFLLFVYFENDICYKRGFFFRELGFGFLGDVIYRNLSKNFC